MKIEFGCSSFLFPCVCNSLPLPLVQQAKVSACEKCSGILSPVTGPPGELGVEESPVVTKLHQQIRELELELAQTKLALVESECKNQVGTIGPRSWLFLSIYLFIYFCVLFLLGMRKMLCE